MLRSSSPRKKRKTLAQQADKHALYEQAVQQPVLVVEFIERMYEQMTGDSPVSLREDFCGTANLAALWVRSDEARRATAVDNDAKVLRYAQRYTRKPMGERAGRLKLKCDDVMHCHAKADIIAALNFSWCIYHERAQLVRYLRHVARCLKPGGLLLLDQYGGPGAMQTGTEIRRFGDFTYEWEQADFDPLTHHVTNHIHFRFPDRSILKRAFTYHWRLWTIPELIDCLDETGYTDVAVTYEDESGQIHEHDMHDAEAWVAYIVARHK